MNLQKNTEKPILSLNLKGVPEKIAKGESHDGKSSKGTKRYEPSNILIKNYLAASGPNKTHYFGFLDKEK